MRRRGEKEKKEKRIKGKIVIMGNRGWLEVNNWTEKCT